ncbi:spore maturation protein [Niameybacter massiliensis]|uniref:Spore maturation protein n=1 Tax=Holtiella tumoricola TaxID=3018743 RepID=A0AA42DR59_9FIRM|nr:nucleoside recognition domain-containing protein [Holtiella tumoricola]MDA3733408.1 spore maturation protein [Holtiella tumoricola]
MKAFMYISDLLIPLVMCSIVIYGLLHKVDIFQSFIDGAKEGLCVVVSILPTLVALMLGVGMLKSSGGLDGLVRLLSPLVASTNFPKEVLPIALMRTVSSSASTGLILDIFQTYGPDSFIGRLVSIMFGCTETIFYTMSVYFMTIKVKNTRYTVVGGLIASFVGILCAYFLTCYLFG